MHALLTALLVTQPVLVLPSLLALQQIALDASHRLLH
jgi:hypothetical protein